MLEPKLAAWKKMKPLWKSLPLLAVLLFTVVQADGEEIIADTHFNKKLNS